MSKDTPNKAIVVLKRTLDQSKYLVKRHTRSIAIDGCYHCIPGEILSHFYVRQSPESPILRILEAFQVNRVLGKKTNCRTPT